MSTIISRTKINVPRNITRPRTNIYQNYVNSLNNDNEITRTSNFRISPSTTMNSSANSSIGTMRGLSTKDALDLIPLFSGEDTPVEHFVNGCLLASEIIPPVVQPDFVNMIKMGLKGEALKTVEGLHFNSIRELANFLEKRFEPIRTYLKEAGKLGECRQGKLSIIAFSNKIK